jgi:hypothetical protein
MSIFLDFIDIYAGYVAANDITNQPLGPRRGHRTILIRIKFLIQEVFRRNLTPTAGIGVNDSLFSAVIEVSPISWLQSW